MNNQRFEFIDGLRGIAALCVVFFHLHLAIQNHYADPFHPYLAQLFSFGYLGIEIFFVLSGFVIAYSLRREKLDFSFFTHFFIRRSIRLDPPFWTTVGLILMAALVANLTFKSESEFPFSFTQIFYNLFYLADLMQVAQILPVAWTLCVEFQFYLIFAVLMMFFQLIKIKKNVSTLVWIGFSFFSIMQNTPWALLPIKPVTFIPHWYSFFLGCTTCWVMTGKMEKKFVLFNYLMIAACSLWTPTPHAIVSVITALIIFTVSMYGKLHVLLKESFFQYLGKISYSIYLIHWPIGMKLIDMGYKLIVVNNLLSLVILWASSLLLSILAADLFYRFIEGPSHAYSRKFKYSKTVIYS